MRDLCLDAQRAVFLFLVGVATTSLCFSARALFGAELVLRRLLCIWPSSEAITLLRFTGQPESHIFYCFQCLSRQYPDDRPNFLLEIEQLVLLDLSCCINPSLFWFVGSRGRPLFELICLYFNRSLGWGFSVRIF